ncbi:cytochrome c-type biogenesis protein CcmH [Sandaracinobacter neustonicus]|uniref:Cytochrome c-type biogenesis protein n=1 Tax=Sandaracinobacter neustonicus TaxID=1715348 RepID=A0A501XU95_9SPHN|nr:cytochrome c-type biogenesis protein [Sandaracinobacter neustonicus]TPE63694.1 cytochrome c-type biogenesis protein CcmH [Sandaracinobacter neustonicus]
MKAFAIALLLIASPVLAEPPTPPDVPLSNPVQEQRAKAVMAELRCLTCQNQSIADSNAAQAQAMRMEVRERIAAGEEPEAVRAFFVERYGDWVSFVPPAREDTALLWAAPLLFLGIGVALVARRFRR